MIDWFLPVFDFGTSSVEKRMRENGKNNEFQRDIVGALLREYHLPAVVNAHVYGVCRVLARGGGGERNKEVNRITTV